MFRALNSTLKEPGVLVLKEAHRLNDLNPLLFATVCRLNELTGAAPHTESWYLIPHPFSLSFKLSFINLQNEALETARFELLKYPHRWVVECGDGD